ncbi:histidine phosphatase family protein [Candidatus Woesearchaeota archaeon]|nr:histidine phosphatase family protein [Candidatus Woesearchaeota archaeon]
MRLIIVRHGETHANLNDVTQGHRNTQLTPRGKAQARKVAERLKDERIDAAYTSDLDRALHTTQEILNHHPATELVTTPLLREQAKGIHEGRPHKERDRLLEETGTPFHKWQPEGGESLGDVQDKAISFLKTLEEQHINHNVLVVSHGGPIACMLTSLHDEPLEAFHRHMPRKNTAVTIIDLDGGKPSFRRVNCSRHLD